MGLSLSISAACFHTSDKLRAVLIRGVYCMLESERLVFYELPRFGVHSPKPTPTQNEGYYSV